MVAVNWNVFEQLPGSPERNFEALCRALMQRHYGKYGGFKALASQPGIEFHLNLHTSCALGEPGRWYGWQCRWYALPPAQQLGATRRKKIEEAIALTEKVLPDLTDWVLWTRHPLTKKDQGWFWTLPTRIRLHLWTSANVEDHLSGDGEIFRGTYFGELVLSDAALAELYEASLAPIKRRLEPRVHQKVGAERTIRQALGETDIWNSLDAIAAQLDREIVAAKAYDTPRQGSPGDLMTEVINAAYTVMIALRAAYQSLQDGDRVLLSQQLAVRPKFPAESSFELLRHMRSRGNSASLILTNLVADVRQSCKLLNDMQFWSTTQLVAVLAKAGYGKTELTAEITKGTATRPAGILLHGSNLHAGQNLNQLAGNVVIQGKPVASIEALFAAVNAAGQRARTRLPIAIDGLNEAEDPRNWKSALASVQVLLPDYPYVLVVVTLRSEFASEILAPGMYQIEIPDFGIDASEAMHRYFAYYRINVVDASLPLELLDHPLTLRLFCEVTNPKHETEVSADAAPGSLTVLFDRYIEQVAERISELAPSTHRYYHQDIRRALDIIGTSLWEMNSRSLDVAELRKLLDDGIYPWNESIVRALEQDGILLRFRGEAPEKPRVGVVYDALAGHLIADAIITKEGRTGFGAWIKNPENLARLAGARERQHSLGGDIFTGFVGLVPKRLHRQQLWPLLEEPLRTAALEAAADLDSTSLDETTVAKLAGLVIRPWVPGEPRMLDRLMQTRSLPNHPLNASFLDHILRALSVEERDLVWSEWIRHNHPRILDDLRGLEYHWRSNPDRSHSDLLRARWVMWTLSSTVRDVRDQATRALYCWGRGNPAMLFELAVDSLEVNDAYIWERLLAVGYGVSMAHQVANPAFGRALLSYLISLRDAFVLPKAQHPTSHWLARLYIEGTAMFAVTHYPQAVPEGLFGANAKVNFAAGPMVEAISDTDARAGEVDKIFRIDFENYTLGRLFHDRGNYDMEHAGHKSAVAYCRGVAWAYGWRDATLGAVDSEIADRSWRPGEKRIERYGKKYAWVGFYMYAGILDDAGKLKKTAERLAAVDIDPSFPMRTPPAPVQLDPWALPRPAEDKRWISDGVITIPDELLCQPALQGRQGPWLAVYGYLDSAKQAPGRRVYGQLTGLLVSTKDSDRLVRVLNDANLINTTQLPEASSDFYTFAGEIPWSPQFAQNLDGGDRSDLYSFMLQLVGKSKINVEILAHYFAWEDYHSTANDAGSALVPSHAFSRAFHLRGIPQSFNQVLPDGGLAALSFSAPAGFNGNILYLRADLVHHYAKRRELVWFISGERLIYPNPYAFQDPPNWLANAQQRGVPHWQYVAKESNLLPRLADKSGYAKP